MSKSMAVQFVPSGGGATSSLGKGAAYTAETKTKELPSPTGRLRGEEGTWNAVASMSLVSPMKAAMRAGDAARAVKLVLRKRR